MKNITRIPVKNFSIPYLFRVKKLPYGCYYYHRTYGSFRELCESVTPNLKFYLRINFDCDILHLVLLVKHKLIPIDKAKKLAAKFSDYVINDYYENYISYFKDETESSILLDITRTLVIKRFNFLPTTAFLNKYYDRLDLRQLTDTILISGTQDYSKFIDTNPLNWTGCKIMYGHTIEAFLTFYKIYEQHGIYTGLDIMEYADQLMPTLREKLISGVFDFPMKKRANA